ncbi:MAG: polysaccharide biosynthesis/export family protein [Mariprofundales bacterium]
MFFSSFRLLSFTCAILGMLLSGCAFAPGLYMDEAEFSGLDVPGRGFREDDSLKDFRDNVRIIPITPQLVAEQLLAAAQSQAQAPGLPVMQDMTQYRVQALDVLQIVVWDHPELINPGGGIQLSPDLSGTLIRHDGTIFYPYIGVIEVKGKTVEQIRKLLTKRLMTYVGDPQVDVRVLSFRSQKIYVTGQVAKRGVLSITDAPLTLIEAIELSGGALSDIADLSHVTINRAGKTHIVNLQALLERGDTRQNVLLQHDDIVHVPDNTLNKVFVMGEVTKQQSLPMLNNRMTLTDAIGDSNGFNLDQANPGRVYVIRGKLADSYSAAATPQERMNSKLDLEIYRLNASSPDALLLADQFHLQPRDVVYVASTDVVRWSRVLRPISSLFQAAAVIRTLTR